MPIQPPPIIDPVPTPVPSTNDPTNFSARADATLGWLPGGVEGIQDVADNVYGNALEAEAAATAAAAAQAAAEAARLGALSGNTRVATSVTPHSFTPGTKTFALQEAGRTLTASMEIVAYRGSDVSARMYGVIDPGGVAGQNITASFTTEGIIPAVLGSGPFQDWVIVDAGFFQTGATVEEERAGSSQLVASTPYSRTLAQDPQNLVSAATITWNANLGANARVTLLGNHQVGAPTSLKDGLIYTLDINPATFTPTWDAIWDFTNVGGQPALAASTWTKIRAQYNADRAKLEVFAGPIRGYVQLAQATPAGASQIDFTSIPSTYSDLLVVVDGPAQSTGGAISLNLAVSPDGVTFSSAVTMLGNWIAGSNLYGTVEVPGYRRPVGRARGVSSTAPSAGGMSTTSNTQDAIWRIAAGIQALRLSTSAGTMTGGTITLYGKK